MGKDSKRRHIAEKQIKAKLPVLPIDTLEKLARISNNWIFPDSVTNMPTNTDTESKRFHLCFDYFNWNTCVLTQFDDTKARTLLKIFEGVTKCELKRFPELKLVRDSVSNTPTYESLFSGAGVSPDVDMRETELPGNGRMFFFLVEHHFNIVSIETKHRDPH